METFYGNVTMNAVYIVKLDASNVLVHV